MQIVHIASEFAPIAKVGGLADVVAGLTQELANYGHHVTIILPKYRCVDFSKITLEERRDELFFSYDGNMEKGYSEYYRVSDAICICFIDIENLSWQKRSEIYGNAHEDIWYFLLFSRAAVEWVINRSKALSQIDIIHIHDWQTAAVAGFFQTLYTSYKPKKIILTLHNLEHQGRCSWEELKRSGYNSDISSFQEMALDLQYGCANILKLGIIASDYVTTVSPTYAEEVLRPDLGRGLHDLLKAKGARFLGILNGIDDFYWNPEFDPFLQLRYSSSDEIETIIHAKKMARNQLWSSLGCSVDNEMSIKPLIGVVTRLVEQKGIGLIEHILQKAEELDVCCVLLGSSGSPEVHSRFSHLNHTLRQKGRGAVVLHNSEEVAHLIYAASDMLLVPSLFEPCGLTQIIAMKYGTIPIVRLTGGLADTVVDIDYPISSQFVVGTNGFVFQDADITGIFSALNRALHYFRFNPDLWKGIIRRVLMQNFNWHNSIVSYLTIYSS